MSELSDLGRRYLAPAERAEYESMLAEVIRSTNVTADRLDLFQSKLADAVQADRAWAGLVQAACVRDGAAAEIKRFQDRDRALVSHDGQVLNLPRVQGVRRKDSEGFAYDARVLIEACTWEEISAKRDACIQSARRYTQKVAHYDHLLALREMAPDAASPREAAKAIGTTVEAWLSGAASGDA